VIKTPKNSSSPASSQLASSATSKKKTKVKSSTVAPATVASSSAAPASSPNVEIAKTPARHTILLATPKESRDFEAEELEMREERRRKDLRAMEQRRKAILAATPTPTANSSPLASILKKRKGDSKSPAATSPHSSKKAKVSEPTRPPSSEGDNLSGELPFLPPSLDEVTLEEYCRRLYITDDQYYAFSHEEFLAKVAILKGYADDMHMEFDASFIKGSSVVRDNMTFLPAFVVMDTLHDFVAQLWNYGARLREAHSSAYDQGFCDGQAAAETDDDTQDRIRSLESELAAAVESKTASDHTRAVITQQLRAAQDVQTALQATIDSLHNQIASGLASATPATSTEISVKEKEAAVKWVNQVQQKGDYSLSNTSTPPEYSQAMDYVWREQISLTDPSKQAGLLIIILRQWLPEGFINRLEVAARRREKPLEQCTAEEIKQLYVDTLCLRDDIVAYFDKGIQLPLKKNTTMRQYLGILQRLFSVYPEASHRFVEAYNWMITTYVNHGTSARWSSLFSEIKSSLPRSSSKADQALLDTLFEKLQTLLDRLKTEAEKNSDLQHPDLVIPLGKTSNNQSSSDRDYTAGAVDSTPAPCAICNMTNHVTSQHTDKKRKRDTPYNGRAQSQTTPRQAKFPNHMYDRNASCGQCGVRGHRDDQCQASADRKERYRRYITSKASRAGASVENSETPPASTPSSQVQSSIAIPKSAVTPTKYIVLVNDREFEFKDKADYERSRRLAAALPQSSAAPLSPTSQSTRSRPTTPLRE
jgi:hypothetical protein